MPEVRNEAVQFLRACVGAGHWTALLLKHVGTGWSVQRTGSLEWACQDSVLDWLRTQNAAGSDVYASVNALAVGARSRTRLDVAVARHVFLDVDRDAQGVLRQLERRSDIPRPGYVVHTSPARAHILWRVRDFSAKAVEQLQKQLATDVGGDRAATSVAQLTRLPGFWNHKHDEPYMVWVDYRDVEHVYTPRDFPQTEDSAPIRPEPVPTARSATGHCRPVERAEAYLSQVPPAVAGQYGDLHTFQTCCRVVRGFALDDDQAFAVLADWNARCQPPWTERQLLQKIRSARRNGREPIGGLL